MTNPSATISHDETIFEGIKRPVGALLFCEKSDIDILERYLGDIQNLFLKKFSVFSTSDDFSEKDYQALRSILEEMMKVKTLLKKTDKDESYA